MSYDYFYGQSGELFSYFRIPKALFQDHRFRQLSTDARTLYGILLDRMSLSAKNGWLDEQGRVYIMLESFLQEPERLTDDDVMLLLKLIFHRQDTQELLKKLLEREKPETP